MDKNECLIKEVFELYPNPKYGDYIIYKGYQFTFDGTEWVIVQ